MSGGMTRSGLSRRLAAANPHLYTPDPTVEARVARPPPEARHRLAEGYHHIPTAVAGLREHFLPARLDAAAVVSSRIH